MKRVVINQSNYIPWKGYFDLIHDADIFIFYDDIQYTKQDWRNRNKLKSREGSLWITVPVGKDINRLISDVSISTKKWQNKHFKTLFQLYSKSPFFDYCENLLEQIYIKNQWQNLSDLNQFIIKSIAKNYFGSDTIFLRSSDYPCSGRGEERIITLLEAVNADVYISGPAASAYLNPETYKRKNIKLVWKDYSGYPEYPQFNPPFDHAVSILDLLFHTGPEASYYIWGWRSGIK